jgi:hypothetical protein
MAVRVGAEIGRRQAAHRREADQDTFLGTTTGGPTAFSSGAGHPALPSRLGTRQERPRRVGASHIVERDQRIDALLYDGLPSSGLIAIPDSFTVQHRDRIIALAARYRLPAVYSVLPATPSGGLMAYRVDTRDTMQRAAGYVDRILNGAKSADLPVQQPAKFQLSINLKTAKAIGLDVAPNLLARAD